MTGPTILGIPYDASSSYLRGPAAAAPLIRRALESPSSNSWSETGRDLSAPGVMEDAGDADLSGDNPRAAIEQAVRDVLETRGLPISLGGDHSITYPILRAIRPAHRRLTILHIDAHSDL